ncbi:MAG: hypothetical protein R2712_05175 [Vicinamibacterales bacterium]
MSSTAYVRIGWLLPVLVSLALAGVPQGVEAGQKKKKDDAAPEQAPSKSDNYDELVARYLEAARMSAAGPRPEANAWMNGLLGELRAQRVNDLVTVRVVEVITARGTADSTLSKESGASAGVDSLFGAEKLFPRRSTRPTSPA